MALVAPVRLAYNPKTLWFNAQGLEIHDGDPVVVLTARGVEFGHAAGDVFEIDEAREKQLKSPLKPVKRLATPEDEENARAMEAKGREALPIFKEMAAELNEDMHPVSVEYLLEGDKAIFYFEAEERVDFRELVRKLASRFHVRVDMRQIGVRDEARMVGGLGHCGQELCCARMGGEFCPVSIRMAKEQDLSLNPQKISGVCGRLMCCLRYEYDAYKDFHGRAPKKNATITTPDGPAKVVDLDVPREVVSVRIEGEKPVKVALGDFDPAEEGARPNTIGQDAWDEATAPEEVAFAGTSLFSTDQFTGSDKLAEAGSVRRVGSGGGKKKGKGASGDGASSEGRKARRRRTTKAGAEGSQDKQPGQGKKKPSQKKQQSQRQNQGKGKATKGADGNRQRNRNDGQARQSSSVRPGQKSSALRQQRQAAGQGAPSEELRSASADSQAKPREHRRSRRRTHKVNGEAAE